MKIFIFLAVAITCAALLIAVNSFLVEQEINTFRKFLIIWATTIVIAAFLIGIAFILFLKH